MPSGAHIRTYHIEIDYGTEQNFPVDIYIPRHFRLYLRVMQCLIPSWMNDFLSTAHCDTIITQLRWSCVICVHSFIAYINSHSAENISLLLWKWKFAFHMPQFIVGVDEFGWGWTFWDGWKRKYLMKMPTKLIIPNLVMPNAAISIPPNLWF